MQWLHGDYRTGTGHSIPKTPCGSCTRWFCCGHVLFALKRGPLCSATVSLSWHCSDNNAHSFNHVGFCALATCTLYMVVCVSIYTVLHVVTCMMHTYMYMAMNYTCAEDICRSWLHSCWRCWFRRSQLWHVDYNRWDNRRWAVGFAVLPPLGAPSCSFWFRE